MDSVQEFTGRQDSLGADQAENLDPEGDKCDQVDDAQDPEKQRANQAILGRLRLLAVEESCWMIEKRPMSGHEAIHPLG